jgi:acyl carrier protein
MFNRRLIPSLRELLKQKLPEHMMPSDYVLLDDLPLTPNGKLDRKALPAPDNTRRELTGNFVGPTTPVEKRLVGIWCEILGLERIGIHDNFFEIGGHSLLATQVISRLRSAFHLNLPLRSLFETPTVASLAKFIEVLRWAGESRSEALVANEGDRQEIVEELI